MTVVQPSTPPRPREVSGEFGIYVHVPFCAHRCWYCDFNTYAGLDHLQETYMRALIVDAREGRSLPVPLGERPRVTSVFVGGGTPSRVGAETLVAVLDAIRDGWDVPPDVEITVECNPEDAALEKFGAYREAGVTRLSFGVQTLDDTLLSRLGRVHDAAAAMRALRTAREAGFESLNADLIFGIPGEDDDRWRSSLEGVLSCGVSHVSAYGLTYEEGTPLHSWRRLGKITAVPEDDVARRWEMADRTLEDAGMRRYEISNWARPGEASRHNSLYWACGEYLGVGAGAHSHVTGPEGSVRSWTVKAPERYLRAIEGDDSPVGGREMIDVDGRAAEVLFLGLRCREGVTARAFRTLVGRDLEATYGRELERLGAQGLLTWDGKTVRLTHRGTLLANEVMTAFL